MKTCCSLTRSLTRSLAHSPSPFRSFVRQAEEEDRRGQLSVIHLKIFCNSAVQILELLISLDFCAESFEFRLEAAVQLPDVALEPADFRAEHRVEGVDQVVHVVDAP